MAFELVGLDLVGEAAALAQVIMIDIVLAGDNAIVVGMAAAGVAPHLRARVIFYGIVAAVLMRIGFALITTQLLALVGLTLAGGLLLLWVAWKMYREIRASGHVSSHDGEAISGGGGQKSFSQAIIQLIIADISMSLDNVLAVAGAARDHLTALIIGLVLSVALMGTAASFIATYLTRFRWLTYVGLLVILFVAVDMIWRGLHQVACVGMTPNMCDNGIWSVIHF